MMLQARTKLDLNEERLSVLIHHHKVGGTDDLLSCLTFAVKFTITLGKILKNGFVTKTVYSVSRIGQ